MSFFLPENYVEQNNFDPDITYFDDMTCQPDVYRLAYHIFKTGNFSYIVDIGSGNGDKLSTFKDAKVYCVDLPENRPLIENNLPDAFFIPIDLNTNSFIIPDEILKNSVVICSDVIEHLVFPDKLAKDLNQLMKVAGFVIVSTPDRIRLRGVYHVGPPDNLAHIREWSIQEFYGFMRSIDTSSNMMIGFTLDNDKYREHNNIIVLGGIDIPNNNHATSGDLKIKCIIEYVKDSIIINRIMHFYKYLRFDFSFIVRESLEVDFLSEIGDAEADYTIVSDDIRLNERIVIEMSGISDYDWITFHQSNTIMISPWHDVSLPQAFSWLNRQGYSRVSFTSFKFYKEFDKELKLFSEKELEIDASSWALSLNNKPCPSKTYPLNFIVKKYYLEKTSKMYSNQIQWKIMTTFHELFVERVTGSYL